MQKVELYRDAVKAFLDMKKHIREGWRIHTCTLGSAGIGYSSFETILVVYEKER